MAYTKTVWVNGTSPAISDTNLNKIEQGIYDSLRQDGTTAMSAQLVTVAGDATTPAIAPTGDSNNGIFFPAADVIALGTAGSERLRVNSSGNIGIGINDQSYKLDVAAYAVTPLRAQRSGEYGEVIKIGRYGVSDGAGIGYPADNTLSIITNANERVRVTSTGNVGIGTTSPTAKLDVRGAGEIAKFCGTNTSNTYITFGDGTTQFGDIGYDARDTNAFSIFNGQSGPLIFGAVSERMRITSAGNVGIGTTSPSAKLELSDGTVISQIDTVSSSLYFGTKSNHPIILFTNNTEKVRIDTSGNLGIGVSPNTKLHVKSAGETLRLETTSATGDNFVRFYAPSSTTLGYLGYTSAGNNNMNVNQVANADLLFHTNNTERVRITSAGNVGIGTTEPQSLLHVGSGHGVKLSEGTSLWSNKKVIETGYSTEDWTDILVASSGSNTARLRLTYTGYALIGYTSSNGAYPLQVNGQIFATSSTIATSDQRYKENVTPLTGALDLVNALNPVQFDWKKHQVHNFNTEQPTVGFLAQEVAEVLKDQPYLNSVIKKSECTWETETGEFVDKEVQTQIENEDGTTDTVIEIIQEAIKETHTEEFYGIAESNLIAILTKAVQELSAKVTALEAQIASK